MRRAIVCATCAVMLLPNGVGIARAGAAQATRPPVVTIPIDAAYGTLAFRGTVERIELKDAYEYRARLTVTFRPRERVNRVEAAALRICSLVASRPSPLEGAPPEVLFKEEQVILADLSGDGATAALPVLAFRLPKAIAAKASHVRLGVSDGHILWPLPVELVPDVASGPSMSDEARLAAEVEIYTLLMRDSANAQPNSKAGTRPLIVLSATMDPKTEYWWTPPPEFANAMKPMDLRARVPMAPESVVTDFLAVSGQPRSLERAFTAGDSVTVIARAELDAIFRQSGTDGWSAFYARYPAAPGYFSFSRVGFDRAGGQALVYQGHFYGNLGATGELVLLRRTGARWTIVRRIAMWMS